MNPKLVEFRYAGCADGEQIVESGSNLIIMSQKKLTVANERLRLSYLQPSRMDKPVELEGELLPEDDHNILVRVGKLIVRVSLD